jgi:hypothetical protein
LQHFELKAAHGGADAATLESFSPGDGSLIARVATSSASHYETVVTRAVDAARSWADVPAPARGQLVRHIADELRSHKQQLAALVTLENGKIMAEALGEVQEMIDMADFAVGQSRMLYGRTMHSERVQHRMYEQWHPLGVVGNHHRLQLSGRGLVMECAARGYLRQCLHLEAVAKDSAVRPGGTAAMRARARASRRRRFSSCCSITAANTASIWWPTRASRYCPSPVRPRSAAR